MAKQERDWDQDACGALCGSGMVSLAEGMQRSLSFVGGSFAEGILHPLGRGVSGEADDDFAGGWSWCVRRLSSPRL